MPSLSMIVLDSFKGSDCLGARPLNRTPASPDSIDRIRYWLSECRKNHKNCRNLRKKLRQQCPTRLIEVGDANSEVIRICSPLSTVSYAVLSYRWGKRQKSTTTSALLEQRRIGFPLKELPLTIQEAVKITRELDLSYLWVDAICIIQDDTADKEREMKTMGHVYAGASITITAARATDADDSFLQNRNLYEQYGTACRVKYRPVVAGNEETGPCLICTEPLDIMYDDLIDERGWTFQERYRSFRTLRFGRKQTVWNCPSCDCVDGGSDFVERVTSEDRFTGTVKDNPWPHKLDDVSHQHELDWFLEVWQDLVAQYSRRELTYQTDKLPAFAAMAEAFGAFLGLQADQYCAGLWKFDMCMQLLWRRSDRVPAKERGNKMTGPTWSWASLDGPVEYEHPRLPWDTEIIHVKDCQVIRKSREFEYGEVESARLTISGALYLVFWCDDEFIVALNSEAGLRRIFLEVWWDCQEERSSELWCLEVQRRNTCSLGLILVQSAEEIYKRLGYFELSHDEQTSEWLSGNPPQKICIE